MNAVDQCPDPLALVGNKITAFNEFQATLSHCQGLSFIPVRLVQQCLVLLAQVGTFLSLFSAGRAPGAIGVEAELQLLVPVLLLRCEEDEHPATIAAFTFNVVVVRDGNGCRRLPQRIRRNSGVRNSTGSRGMPVQKRAAAEIGLRIQASVPRATAVSGVLHV